MEIVDHVHQHLAALDASFEVIDIDPDLADTAAFCERYRYGPEESANAILVASKRPPGQFALCLVLATSRLDVNRSVRGLMNVKKLSFASADLTIEQTGMMIGGVTPFGISTDIPLYVDARVMDLAQVIVGGGDRATKILVDPAVFNRMPHAQIVEGLANPIPDDGPV
jgi:prolyl-tRNA editing enzyme YbaK/EbsC (Cys-tRNA(Pro) deacylase)